ncbi:7TM diverse intracellular signaling domain-containing protein [Arcobacter ellisii]|uniref:histidine kinase n=1 Tax=Arcobacter ellisii TaxID=913109 RepID=A0A347U7Z4_9BACT|nr:7TM diverse intracellular signaling domain-containing protein [Arcobacter ellisii]AXX94972.1 7TMR-DISM-7TM/7TMR-DISMED2 domain-containing two-component system sensor histidine kinase [Arcobacter ellisii]RXI30296.1 histidine kinase [Arcobacter ellisii]
MFYLKIIFLLLFSSTLFANIIDINEETKTLDILSKSEIYIDKNKNLTFEDIKNQNIKFEKNNKNILSYGYSPTFDVWIKFTLKNSSKKTIKKIIEYDNPLTTNVDFFDFNKNSIQKDGLLSKDINKFVINPIFSIELNPNEENTYFIKASSFITTLIIDLKLLDEESFYKKEIKHQIILSLFFGAMFILGIYNFFIYLFTRDISYLYYVLYILGLIIHHLMYTGIANVYFLNYEQKITIVSLASVIVAIPVYALGLFTKSFLQTKQYKKFNMVLNGFLILIPISVIFFLVTDDYDKYRNTFTMLFLVFLMIITLYATLKKNKQAYFIFFAWVIFLSSGLLMYLSSAGIFDIKKYFPYLIEASFVIEAIIFSIALANKITNLQKEKNEANQKLIIQKENETKRLSNEVNLRTKDLKNALDEKELLLKELNHRVKNNMQTIVSLIRLQSDEIENEKLKDILLTIQNRISAMGHLHELLYKQDDINYIDVYEYFEVLIDEVRESYDSFIEIHLDIKTKLKMEQSIYCGLIINELITNSFKYAFPDKKGNILITLEKENENIKLTIKDDGIGFDETKVNFSLGFTLVKTLAVSQLKGEIDINSKNGVTTTILWNEDE